MNLRFKCDCGCLIVVPMGQAGKRGPCPSCGKLVRAPMAPGVPAVSVQPEVLPTLTAAPPSAGQESAVAPPRSPFVEPLPLLSMHPEFDDVAPRKRTTAILRPGTMLAPREEVLPRPRVDVAHRSCPECAEQINARATECFYCRAEFQAKKGGLTRRILPGQLYAGVGGMSTLALRFSVLGLILPVYALSLIGIGLGGQTLRKAPEGRAQTKRQAEIAIGLGVAGCVISTLLILFYFNR